MNRIPRCGDVGATLLILTTALYVWTASGTAFWLDSSELSAAGWTLGIPHPPGHPLHVLLVRAFAALPLGPIAFKAHLLSACCGGLAAWLGFLLARELLVRFDDENPSLLLPAASALLASVSGAMWLQSVRAEVYTLQAALGLAAIWMAVRWDRAVRSEETGWWSGTGPLVGVSLSVGLGLANHHYLMVWIVPALLLVLLTNTSGRAIAASRQILAPLGAGLLGLCTYLLLPIRSAAEPVINWGHPSTLERFLDTISARVFHASVTDVANAGFLENAWGVGSLVLEQLTPLSGVLAAIGLLFLIQRAPRAAGWWTMALVGNVASVAIMNFDRTNPDTWGYLQLTHVLVAVACAVGVAGLAGLMPTRKRLIGLAGTAIILLMTTASAAVHAPRSNLADFNAARVAEDALLGEVPPGGVMMSSFFSVFFQHWHAQLVEGRRPDVVIFNQTFDAKIHEGIPHVTALRAREPELAPVFDAFLRTRQFPVAEVLSLAKTEPVFVEPELNGPVPHGLLRQRGLAFQVADVSPRRDQGLDLLPKLKDIGGDLRESRTFLFWHHFHATVALLGGGAIDAASMELKRVQAVAPTAPRVQILHDWIQALEAASPADRERLRRQLLDGDFDAWYRGEWNPFPVEPARSLD